MASSTPAYTPPDKVTDEAIAQGMKLGREVGAAYRRMVEYFFQNVAVSGQKKRAGEFEVGLAVQDAEPLYFLEGGQLRLAQPAMGANAHLEVVVMDADDGRFIPELTVVVTARSAQGDEVGTFRLPFMWHPIMFHYGASIHIPSDGEYAVTVGIDTPTFPRHDKVNGKRYTGPVLAEFTGVRIKTGRK
jgi:hypothetical protein